MDKRRQMIDRLRLDSVNNLHYRHQNFQESFKKVDVKYTRLTTDLRKGSNPPREKPDIITSFLWLHEDLTHLHMALTLRLMVDDENWLLQNGYAKQVRDYYHPKWESMSGAVTNKIKAVNDLLKELGFDDSNSKAKQKQ